MLAEALDGLPADPADRTTDGVPGLLRALLDDGVAVHEARRLAPSLEDVYLALHGRDRPGDRDRRVEEVRRNFTSPQRLAVVSAASWRA